MSALISLCEGEKPAGGASGDPDHDLALEVSVLARQYARGTPAWQKLLCLSYWSMQVKSTCHCNMIEEHVCARPRSAKCPEEIRFESAPFFLVPSSVLLDAASRDFRQWPTIPEVNSIFTELVAPVFLSHCCILRSVLVWSALHFRSLAMIILRVWSHPFLSWWPWPWTRVAAVHLPNTLPNDVGRAVGTRTTARSPTRVST